MNKIITIYPVRKRLKCIKCGLYFKDRKDPNDMLIGFKTVNAELCWNCRFIWQAMGMVLQSFPKKLNRDISISLHDVKITKKKK